MSTYTTFHRYAQEVTEDSIIPSDPISQDFHTYYTHKDGKIWRETTRERTSSDGAVFTNDCYEQARLTVVHLPKDKISHLEIPPEDQRPRVPWPNNPTIPQIPGAFVAALRRICTHCDCKQEILWRNIHRADSHFEACFRYHDDGTAQRSDVAPPNKCFLKLYTLRVPHIAGNRQMVLSMVHHIRAEGDTFVSPSSRPEDNKEHMFCFVAGFEAFDVTQILTKLVPRWSDIPGDHLQSTTGLTPKLFLATVLSQYGFLFSKDIVRSSQILLDHDLELQDALEDLQTLPPDSFNEIKQDTDKIRKLNTDLINMTRKLTGTRSVMHYLASSAGVLIDRVSGFEKYVDARISEWGENPNKERLQQQLLSLDSSREKLRDCDKLQIVQKCMEQHMVDIEALHTHIDINISMVRNLIAEQDRAIQFSMAIKSTRDGFNMKIIAILTVIFLPSTFMAILFTTPMFHWDAEPEEPLILKLPFKIYWIISGSMTILFAIGLFFLSESWMVKWLVDKTRPEQLRNFLQGFELYRRASDRVERTSVIKEEKQASVVRKASQHEKHEETLVQRFTRSAKRISSSRPASRNRSTDMEEGRSSDFTKS